MNDKSFWGYIHAAYMLPIETIESLGFENVQCELIKNKLKRKGAEEIVEFQLAFSEKMLQLYKPNIAEVFLVTSYPQKKSSKSKFKSISTDGFLDFRAWIIGLGKIHFEIFLNFTSEDEIINYDLNPNTAYREDLVYLAEKLYREINKNFDFPFRIIYDEDVDELYSKMNWENLDAIYPKLFNEYQK